MSPRPGLRISLAAWLCRLGGVAACAALLLSLWGPGGTRLAAAAAVVAPMPGGEGLLSPYWGPHIQRWSTYISALSAAYGFHPDFIAAVIEQEAAGGNSSRVARGAPGLLGVTAAPDIDWRPATEVLLPPSVRLRWGIAVLSYVVQQAGGDLYTALAAYRGGWAHVNDDAPREYAAAVLDRYARALLVRAGLSPDVAARWTIAVGIHAGNRPDVSLLVLGSPPVGELRTYVPHTVYAYAARAGGAYFVRGYVVPLRLTDAMTVSSSGFGSDELEPALRARLGDKHARAPAGNERVLLACLPSLGRLRGQVTTRWYGPSGCPAASRAGRP